MDPLLCFPDPLPIELQKVLEQAGYPFIGITSVDAMGEREPEDGWAGAVVSAIDDTSAALSLCRSLRSGDNPLSPLLLIVTHDQMASLEASEDLFDDFCLAPLVTDEIEARLAHLLWRTGRGKEHDIIVYGPLALNLETYQAVIAGKPLDLTFMEYELLRFLAAHPGKVFTREVLLSRVWGYEYFGGARTVDVHIRRLRAKLGEEHANLIDTVRSVGYRFGRTRWTV
jgi:DNA-binding response OmpR family regulator